MLIWTVGSCSKALRSSFPKATVIFGLMLLLQYGKKIYKYYFKQTSCRPLTYEWYFNPRQANRGTVRRNKPTNRNSTGTSLKRLLIPNTQSYEKAIKILLNKRVKYTNWKTSYHIRLNDFKYPHLQLKTLLLKWVKQTSILPIYVKQYWFQDKQAYMLLSILS